MIRVILPLLSTLEIVWSGKTPFAKCEVEDDKLTKGRKRHVVVVGGGILGTSAAYFLSRSTNDAANFSHDGVASNLKVTLLEKEMSIASGATGLSAGTLYSVGKPKLINSSDTAEYSILDISSRFYKFINDFAEGGINYDMCGCLTLAFTEEESKYAKEMYDEEVNMIEDKNNLQWLASSDIEKILPGYMSGGNVKSAVFARQGGQVNPKEACHYLADIIKGKDNVDIYEDCEVVSIVKTYNIEGKCVYKLSTKDGTVFVADQVILTTGAAVDKLLPENQKLGVIPVKGQMAVSDIDTDADADTNLKFPVVYYNESYFTWKDNTTEPPELTHVKGKRITRHAYGRKGLDGRYYFGGDRFLPRNDNDYEVNEKLLKELLDKKVYSIMPKLRHHFESPQSGSWAGLMPFSKDGAPTIDKVDDDGLFVCSGFGGEGIMLGPGSALFLASWIKTGIRPVELEAYAKR